MLIGTSALQDPVTYTGAPALAIQGHSAELDGPALGPDEAAFIATGGGTRAATISSRTRAFSAGTSLMVSPVVSTGSRTRTSARVRPKRPPCFGNAVDVPCTAIGRIGAPFSIASMERAALEVGTGRVAGLPVPRHTSAEVLRFLDHHSRCREVPDLLAVML